MITFIKLHSALITHASTNLTHWVRALDLIVPLTSTGSFVGFTNTSPYMFFRVEKVR